MSSGLHKPTRSASGAYDNPWQPALAFGGSVSAMLRFPFQRPNPPNEELGFGHVQVVEPDFALFETEDAKKKIGTTWLGHAVCSLASPCIDIIYEFRLVELSSPVALRPPRNTSNNDPI